MGARAATVQTDVCVYGGTSGGVVAAIELARLGRRVELISPGAEIGGMTTGGIGATDIGEPTSVGGIAREVYRRIDAEYRRKEAFAFEPKVARRVFESMLAEAGVVPRRNQKLASVIKSGPVITELRTASGLRIQAREFIDATYEGDLLAQAGVTFAVGRESWNVYGEILAGVRPGVLAHQFDLPVDPFVRPGSLTARLLPWVQKGPQGALGDSDPTVQAYNYRLCLTRALRNRRPITAPANYAESDYNLLARYLSAKASAGQPVRLADVLAFSELPNGKVDVNAMGPFSTDCVGLSGEYPNASPARRAVLAVQHRRYIQGLLFFLGHSAAVPSPVRWEMLQYGLCADEFRSTAGWPHQLYVREARRMISSYVMQQSNCEGQRGVPDSVALGSYWMDSHVCRRVVVDGLVQNEGLLQYTTPAPYGIAYRSIVPRAEECTNLLVTFAVSASHVAFSSLRMEPVHMMLSQSAANAADLAIDGSLPVQDVSYDLLASRLRLREQVLTWPVAPAGAIVVDNADAGATAVGHWTLSSNVLGYFGENYAHNGNAGAGAKSFRFAPSIPAPGIYDVLIYYTQSVNRSTAVPVDVVADDGTHTVLVDQTRNGSHWFRLGCWNFSAGSNPAVVIRTDGTQGYVVADAVAWVPAAISPFASVVSPGAD